MNRVTLVGRITRDPELRTSSNNFPFVAFTIAVNRVQSNANGEREADFINCVAFNKQAENLARFIKKGSLIGVEGKLQTRRYQAGDGSNRVATEVICDMVHFLEPRGTSNQGGYNDYSSYEPRQNSYQPQQNNYQQPQTNSYDQRPYQQPNMNQTPAESDNPFDDIKNQFNITDDDLPF
ncbi:MAG: single-stranded DNA-binding protein [Bacilli bacterium]